MAFDRNKLTIIGNNLKAGETPAMWFYHNADDDTVTTAGYMDDNRINTGDVIMSLKGDSTVLTFTKATVSAGVITLANLTTVTP